MKLKDIQRNKNEDSLDILLNRFYDNEMSLSDKICFEVKIATSDALREHFYSECFAYFKISNSIKLAKIRNETKAKIFTEQILRNENFEKRILLFYINSVLFKYFNKIFSCGLLNIKRNNSK